MNTKHLTKPANPFAIVNDHNHVKYGMEKNPLKNLKLCYVTKADVQEIEEDTILQNKCLSWYELRQTRLTASNFHVICSNLNEKQKLKLVDSILHPQKFSSKSINHGKSHEKTAKFEEDFLKNKSRVEKCGLFIMTHHPYIGATPDGLLNKNSLVAVKCPFTARDSVPDENTVEWLYRKKITN